jgi:predicted Fe-Mo cluster-binding NifX family protein
MKIAVALNNGKLAGHFSSVETFAIYNATADSFEGPVMRAPNGAGREHRPYADVAEALMGCHAVIAGGMGHRIAEEISLSGIEPVISAEDDEPAELARKYAKGQLRRGQFHRCCHSA